MSLKFVEAVITCPKGEYNIQQISNQMLDQTAFEFEKITSPEVIAKVSEFFSANGLHPIPTNTDTIVIFVSQQMAFVSAFFKGCTPDNFWFMDPGYFHHFLQFLGINI